MSSLGNIGTRNNEQSTTATTKNLSLSAWVKEKRQKAKEKKESEKIRLHNKYLASKNDMSR